ncbi:hypothetical protein B296_00045242 [Ensete ventricosum]|uniref:Major facilitator superfamily (MFS) profile domain-containing protein n=1 Tax=Ensete ventricosum TaxID=4639 RepID=A0A426YVB8_ENSVE|nr:hypothetical protein B296_00045242 [Ensete ventricosum]
MASVLTPSATVRPIAGGFASPLPSRLTPTKVHYDPQPLRSMKKSKKNAAASQSSRLPLLPTVITPNLRVRSSFSFVPLLFSPSSCSSFLNFLPLRAKLRPQAQGADYSPPSPSPSDDATEDAFSWSSVFLPCFGVGRRRELIAAAALYLVGGLVTGCAPDLVVLIIGRLIYGIGIGMKKREKRRENLEIQCCSPDPNPSPTGFSALRRENLLAKASQGDFFFPCRLLGEKKRLPA